MMRHIKTGMPCLLTSLLFAGTVHADEGTFVSSEGHRYSIQCNKSGYRLTSLYPVARFIEKGVDSTVETGKEVIFFGKTCEAKSKVLGKAKWCWANGGFNVEFESGQTIGFPRQELSCDNQAFLIDGCGC